MDEQNIRGCYLTEDAKTQVYSAIDQLPTNEGFKKKEKSKLRYNYTRLHKELETRHEKIYGNNFMGRETLQKILEGTATCDSKYCQRLFNSLNLVFNAKEHAVDNNGNAVIPPNTEDSIVLGFDNESQLLVLKENSFIGRKDEIKSILKILNPNERKYIAIIGGESGSGRTSLAMEAILQSSKDTKHRFDKIVQVNFRYSPLDPNPLESGQLPALSRFYSLISQQLSYESIIRAHPDDQKKIALTAFNKSKRRILIFIDDIGETTQKERNEIWLFLSELPSNCKVIVTLCGNKPDLKDAQLENLSDFILTPKLSPEEIEQLTNQISREEGIVLEQRHRDYIKNFSHGKPRMIRNFILNKDMIDEKSISEYASCLADLDRNADDGASDINCWLAQVIESLKHKESRISLIGASLFYSSFSHESLGDVVNEGTEETLKIGIEELLTKQLLTKKGSRLLVTPRVRRYVIEEIVGTEENKGQHENMRERWIEYYIELTKDHGGIDKGDWHEGYDILELEWSNILSVLEWCYAKKEEKKYFDYLQSLWSNANRFTDLYGKWSDRLKWLEKLIDHLKELGEKRDNTDNLNLVRFQTSMGWTLIMLCEYVQAKDTLKDASKTLELTENDKEKYKVRQQLLHNQIVCHTRMYHYDKESMDYNDVVKFLDKKKDLDLDPDEFLKDCSDGELKARFKINTDRDEARLEFARSQKHPEESQKLLEESRSKFIDCIALAEKIQWLRMVSYFYYMLAKIALIQSEFNQAQRYLNYSNFIAEKNHHRRRLAEIIRLRAFLARKLGHLDEANALMQEAKEEFDKLGMIFDEEKI